MPPLSRSAPNWASGSVCSASMKACCVAFSERVPSGSQISRGKAHARLRSAASRFCIATIDSPLAPSGTAPEVAPTRWIARSQRASH